MNFECNNKPVVKSKIDHIMNTDTIFNKKGWIYVTKGSIGNLFGKCIASQVLLLLLYISILIEISLYKYVV